MEIALRDAATGDVFTIPSENIIFVYADTLGAVVSYIKEPSGKKLKATVSDLPAVIAGASDNLILITDSSSSLSYYININRMGIIDYDNMKFDYDVEGSSPQPISVTQTPAQLLTLIYQKENNFVYLFDDVNVTNDTISLAAANGNVTAKFTAGVVLTVFGSSTDSFNGTWLVASSAYAGSKTVISIDGSVPAGVSQTGSLMVRKTT